MQALLGRKNPSHPASVARHPAVPAAVFFLTGISCYARLPSLTLLWIGCIVLCLAIAVTIRRRGLLATLSLATAWLFVGVACGQWAAFQYPADHIGLYATDVSRLAQLELALDDPPRVITNPFDERKAIPPKQVALARVVRVRTTDGWREASGEVLLQINDPHPGLATGQIVRATGMLQRPAPAMNPGQFDCSKYLTSRYRRLVSFYGHCNGAGSPPCLLVCPI